MLFLKKQISPLQMTISKHIPLIFTESDLVHFIVSGLPLRNVFSGNHLLLSTFTLLPILLILTRS